MTSKVRPGRVYIDIRCLQDSDYQFRGVGYHVTSLLRGRRRHIPQDWEVVGLTDADMPRLPEIYGPLVDRVSTCWNPVINSNTVFITASPMTHDPTLPSRFFSHPSVTTAAIVYDFIPLDREGYLPAIADQVDYFAKLAQLKNHDLFLPISEYSAKRLKEVLGISTQLLRVTGASVRQSLYDAAEEYRRRNTVEPREKFFLTVGGGDRRKNTEVVVQAVRELRSTTNDDVKLIVVGHYGYDYQYDLNRIATEGATQTCMEIRSGISDAELVSLYASAIATVAPSHIEGFSLPVVEAAVCGSPVVASMCAAHLELIHNADALFPSAEADVLCDRLIAVLREPDLRETLSNEQRPLADKFQARAVGDRFWTFITDHLTSDYPAFVTGARPRIAFLTPYPPQQSGVSRFSQQTLVAARKYMNLDVYTDADRPIELPDGVTDGGEVASALLRRGPYDGIVSVIGNSHFHIPMFRIMESCGGPCILHDSRLTHIYYWRMGRDAFIAWVHKLLGLSITDDHIQQWMNDQNVPSLFIEQILERAAPLIVHTRRYQDLIRKQYGRDVAVTIFPPNLQFTEDEVGIVERSAARRRVGIADDVFAVATFGYVAASKGIAPLIIALNFLRSWGVNAELFLVGSNAYARGYAEQMALEFEVADYVHTNTEFVSTERYRDYMLAVDAAVQLRTYDFGQPSAALADCISAGIPTVANESLSLSCDGPSYVARIPDHISPLLIAENLQECHEQCKRRDPRILEQRREYISDHNFGSYAQMLTRVLGFG